MERRATKIREGGGDEEEDAHDGRDAARGWRLGQMRRANLMLWPSRFEQTSTKVTLNFCKEKAFRSMDPALAPEATRLQLLISSCKPGPLAFARSQHLLFPLRHISRSILPNSPCFYFISILLPLFRFLDSHLCLTPSLCQLRFLISQTLWIQHVDGDTHPTLIPVEYCQFETLLLHSYAGII
jgi:hypothetical protein